MPMPELLAPKLPAPMPELPAPKLPLPELLAPKLPPPPAPLPPPRLPPAAPPPPPPPPPLPWAYAEFDFRWIGLSSMPIGTKPTANATVAEDSRRVTFLVMLSPARRDGPIPGPGKFHHARNTATLRFIPF